MPLERRDRRPNDWIRSGDQSGRKGPPQIAAARFVLRRDRSAPLHGESRRVLKPGGRPLRVGPLWALHPGRRRLFGGALPLSLPQSERRPDRGGRAFAGTGRRDQQPDRPAAESSSGDRLHGDRNRSAPNGDLQRRRCCNHRRSWGTLLGEHPPPPPLPTPDEVLKWSIIFESAPLAGGSPFFLVYSFSSSRCGDAPPMGTAARSLRCRTARGPSSSPTPSSSASAPRGGRSAGPNGKPFCGTS